MLLNREQAKELGRLGEEYVARYLRENGCIVIKRNWRDRYGEVDIIAEDSENIIFVEVKTRTEGAIVSGVEAIDDGKMRRTKNAALMFVKRLNTDLPPRVDIAEVTVRKGEDEKYRWKLNYIKNAY